MKENIESYDPCLECKINPTGATWTEGGKITSCPFTEQIDRIVDSPNLSPRFKRSLIANSRSAAVNLDSALYGCPKIQSYNPLLTNEEF